MPWIDKGGRRRSRPNHRKQASSDSVIKKRDATGSGKENAKTYSLNGEDPSLSAVDSAITSPAFSSPDFKRLSGTVVLLSNGSGSSAEIRGKEDLSSE